jgi:LmbE family N-acetylglucosaminyl deacetylase
MNILVIVAHSDDQALGPGGTIAKYAAEGHDVYTLIFSYGEGTHPHYKKEVIREIREEESKKADKLLGAKETIFLGTTDGKLAQEKEHPEVQEKLRKALLHYKPEKIFTHAVDEAHPDHVAVHQLLLQVYDELHAENKLTCSIFSFGIWRFFKFKRRSKPRLIVDITDTFTKKLSALKLFKSQKVAMLTLTWSVYVKAIINGYRYGTTFAEVFYKIR